MFLRLKNSADWRSFSSKKFGKWVARASKDALVGNDAGISISE